MKRLEQTLLAQMQITEQEVERRKDLLKLSTKEVECLAHCKPLIEAEIETIVAEFYETQVSDEEIALVIGDADTLQRLHQSQRRYVLDLFEGDINLEYVHNRLRIGQVHKRIGVAPKLYLSAVKTLKDIIMQALARRIEEPTQLEEVSQALDKLLYFDITLVFDTYIRSMLTEIETAKDRVEMYAKNLEAQVAQRTRELKEKVTQLESAMATVKKLEGVLPICGSCKKIRDDKESWHQLEKYISEHSQALFSHGLCPDCYQKQLSEIRKLKEEKGSDLLE